MNGAVTDPIAGGNIAYAYHLYPNQRPATAANLDPKPGTASGWPALSPAPTTWPGVPRSSTYDASSGAAKAVYGSCIDTWRWMSAVGDTALVLTVNLRTYKNVNEAAVDSGYGYGYGYPNVATGHRPDGRPGRGAHRPPALSSSASSPPTLGPWCPSPTTGLGVRALGRETRTGRRSPRRPPPRTNSA